MLYSVTDCFWCLVLQILTHLQVHVTPRLLKISNLILRANILHYQVRRKKLSHTNPLVLGESESEGKDTRTIKIQEQ